MNKTTHPIKVHLFFCKFEFIVTKQIAAVFMQSLPKKCSHLALVFPSKKYIKAQALKEIE